MKKQKNTFTAIITGAWLPCVFATNARGQSAAGRVLSRISRQRKGATRFRTSPPEPEIQELVGMRCLGLLPAASTPALALEPSSSTTQIPTRQWAPQPFYSTPRAQGTAPLEQPPWSIMTTVPTIQLWARSRCKPILTEATTLRWATLRFKIALAISTPPWALERVPIQISAATMSTSAIPVLPAMRM